MPYPFHPVPELPVVSRVTPTPARTVSARYIAEVLAGTIPFAFHYQPIVDLRHGLVTGYEALVRFPSELKMGPDRFLQAAGRYGQRMAVEAMIARAALIAKNTLPPNCFLTVNVSPSLLVSHAWSEILQEVGTLAGVVIEITEEELISDYRPIRQRLAIIHAMGGHVAVDDTGSGYASLKHVMELRPNFIKLDRFFIGDCHNDRAKAAMIEMIGNAADRLDAWIVAEGIETEAEMDQLIRLEIPLGQGYYLGRPDPVLKAVAGDVMARIRSHTHVQTEKLGIESHAEDCAICFSRVEALELFGAHQSIESAVVLDATHRPVEIVRRHTLHLGSPVQQLMKVQRSSEVKDVLHRALTRPTGIRFDSLAMVNELGAFEGIVHIDRLMQAALRSTELAGV